MDSPQPSPSDDQRQLERLKDRIDRALADGYLSRAEREEIMEMAQADGKITEEELALFRMIQTKIRAGEIQIED